MVGAGQDLQIELVDLVVPSAAYVPALGAPPSRRRGTYRLHARRSIDGLLAAFPKLRVRTGYMALAYLGLVLGQ